MSESSNRKAQLMNAHCSYTVRYSLYDGKTGFIAKGLKNSLANVDLEKHTARTHILDSRLIRIPLIVINNPLLPVLYNIDGHKDKPLYILVYTLAYV